MSQQNEINLAGISTAHSTALGPCHKSDLINPFEQITISSEYIQYNNLLAVVVRSRRVGVSAVSTIQGLIPSLLFFPVILPLRIPYLLSHLSCLPCSALVNTASVFTSCSRSSTKNPEEQGRFEVQSDCVSYPLSSARSCACT